MSESPQHEVIIIGAGFSGIGAAIKLREAGFEDHLIVEEGNGVGGTWHWNTYPGIAVDIPSFSYQFSFEPWPNWSRVYAPGEELRAYAEHCVDKYGLRPRIRFGTRIAGAVFDEENHLWRLSTQDGAELTARYVIGATGALTQPKPPDIPGVGTFAGTTLHTARWDHAQSLRGKRVGIIGTGASAVQVIPAIAPAVEHLTVFQRTPIWCLPRMDAPLPAWTRWLLRHAPLGQRALRLLSQTFVEIAFPLAAHYHGAVPIASAVERQGRQYLRAAVRDPLTREQLTPRYALGCKRPSFSNEYLQSFNRANVALETTPIERIAPEGVHTADGTAHELDVLILATGFKVFESGNMPPFAVSGLGGVDLETWWDENRFQAYEGVSVPGFPSLFLVIGPYGYNGSSYFNLIETQTHHILRCLQHARSNGATMIEVRAEANDRYFAEMMRKRGRQVFWQDSCSLANSYYFDKHGDVPLRPSPTLETMWRGGHFDLRDYRLATVRQPAPAAA
jgi:cyclohexanone monooxygenase